MPKYIFKNDKYKKTRGGRSRMLDISCGECHKHLFLYQKDGPGILKRVYIDRIIEPKVSLSGASLSCPSKHLLGVKIIYKKEGRPAFRLFAYSVMKKIVKIK